MLSIAKRVFWPYSNRAKGASVHKIVKSINALEGEMAALSSEALFGKTGEFRKMLSEGTVTLDDLLVPAFAVVREASRRVLDMRHFDVQLIGGIALHRGMIAEMKTGEGKTLVATLAAYLNALESKGVHVVTVNDYLAERDSEWMGKLYSALGISVGCITSSSSDEARKAAYNCDILYSTNNELGFDYLRDNMKFSRENMVQRGYNYAIVDEVDSILIDESRTPLIISGPVERDSSLYGKVDALVRDLEQEDYDIDEKSKTAFLTEDGALKVEQLLISHQLIPEGSSLYSAENIIMMHYVGQALRAHKLYFADKDYIVKNGSVVIIDEFTGRMMDGRRYSDGLHQALEAKEGVRINNENQTLASTTFQNYFRMYKRLSGMTGTAETEADEFLGTYNLQVMQIPTNVPVQRVDLDDDIYCTEEEKYEAVIDFIIECHKRKQPTLVGTISIEKSELLSKLLTMRGIKHSVLNARYHEKEAYIIAQAGKPGAVTIATNMAGRGTDIKLGGNPEMLARNELAGITDEEERAKRINKLIEQAKHDKEIVMQAGGLCIIGTERHESRRIDNQLRGRSGRQGDPGLSKFFLSLEDGLLRIFGSDKVRGMLKRLGMKRGEAIQHKWINRAIERAQKKVEARNYDIRKSLLRFDDVINEQRKVIFAQRNQILDRETYDLVPFYSNLNCDIVSRIIKEKYCDLGHRETAEELSAEVTRIYGIELDMGALSALETREEVIAYLDKVADDLLKKKADGFVHKDENLWDFAARRVLITSLDHLWTDHLAALDSLKCGINLRSVGQKDPLNEFKIEAFYLLEKMLSRFYEMVIQKLAHIELEVQQQPDDGMINLNNSTSQLFGGIARNDRCPCGSGKKFKHCHGMIKV
ncbi:preprotein translocase subunit SecA [Anaplasma phagocytophilum str. Norway variant1]|uniref:Protein translocase subunit SecA n=1 Tax=Anaplasma phagocytophilum str. Norway variant1 TaxID=1392506 RepID=A0A7H9E158_ANAPH|nr:preprotein translocase subunit SecA [Anaplasma phagocytophilum]QLL67066.1 preprotein translocase subunit SecA [Anaplasma phagocytophilum str. Norway variant1]